MFSSCSKTLNIAKADWKLFQQIVVKNLSTELLSAEYLKSFAVKEKIRNFRFHLFTIPQNVILNELSHTFV